VEKFEMKRSSWLAIFACSIAVASACSRESATLSAPTGSSAVGVAVNPDGTSLKVSAPTPVSPINGARFEALATVNLVLANSTGVYASSVPLEYRFEVLNTSGAVIHTSPPVAQGSSGTTYTLPGDILEGEVAYTWQARAVYQAITGPVSTRASFFAPASEGYIKGSELYDPLIKGKTVGEIHGPVQFIPDVGVKLLSEASYIQYTLPEALVEGEMSVIATNLSVISPNEDPKLRMFSMREGEAAFNDNLYRMSVEKRGNGAIAWRFISGPGPYIETIGSERQIYSFHEALTYFVQVTWRSGFFGVLFKENGVNGSTVYDWGKPYTGVYRPSPHNVYIGSPYRAGDRGEPGSLEDEIIRQVWVSSRPRPSFANK
jgi:hypothetical protein